MSFRRRLIFTLFLLLLVPVGATALLATNFASDSKTSQADARISGALPAVADLYERNRAQAQRAAVRIASGSEFAAALAGSDAQIRAAMARIAGDEGLRSLVLSRPSAGTISVGPPGVATGSARVITGPTPASLLAAARLSANEFVVRAEALTDLRVVAWVGDRLVADPRKPAVDVDLAGSAERTVNGSTSGGDLRARVLTLSDGPGPMFRIAVIAEKPSSVLSGQGLQIAVILALFLILAFVLLTPLYRDLQNLHDRAETQAVTDDLTGLSNRRQFKDLFEREIHRSRRFGHDVSVILLDLDDFKKVNDTYGHSTGDAVLKHVAEQVRKESRASDDLARYGGEEFIVALPETTLVGATRQAERIRERIESTPVQAGSSELRVTASFGVAGTPEQRAEVSALFEAADSALYQAKREGKNRVVAAPPREISPLAPSHAE